MLPGRRAALGGLLTLAASGLCTPCCGQARTAKAAPAPAPTTLLVAGPESGAVARWAEFLTPGLARALPSGSHLATEYVGNEDGVTGANQFAARAAPDGSMALLLPGTAALAWLAGDPRAQFDASGWVPAFAALTSAVVASRVPLDRLRPGQPLRLAASNPAGPELPVLIVLEMLGVAVRPVFGLTDENGAVDAAMSGAVDAVFLRGARAAEQVQVLAAAGLRPVLTMGPPEAPGTRDPFFPAIPTAHEAVADLPERRLFFAWRAASASVQTEAALVLPSLTPAPMVAAWRRGCAQAVGVDAQGLPGLPGIRFLPPTAVGGSTAAIAADQATLQVLRQWLAQRWNWRAE